MKFYNFSNFLRLIQSYYFISICIVFLGFGLFIRWHNLSFQSFWTDELYTVVLASKSFFEIFTVTQTDPHPPLYTIFLHFWIKIFGDSPSQIRSLSALFGSLTLIYILWKYIQTKQLTELFFLLFTSVSFGAVFYSQEARSYSLMIFLSVIISYEFLYFIQFKSITKRQVIIFFTVGLVLSYTHYFGFLYVLHLYLFLFLLLKYKVLFSTLGCITVLLYFPEIYKILFILPNLEGLRWIPKPNIYIYFEASNFIFSLVSWKGIKLWIIAIIFLLISSYKREAKYNFEIITLLALCLTFLVTTFLVSQIEPIVTGRNLLVLLFPVLYSFSLWISTQSKLPMYWKTIFVSIICVLSYLSYNKFISTLFKEESREAAEFYINFRKQENFNYQAFCYNEPEFFNYYLKQKKSEFLIQKIPLLEKNLPNFNKLPEKFIFWQSDLEVPSPKFVLEKIQEQYEPKNIYNFRGLKFTIFEKKSKEK